tara:strand:- start:21403 stop:22356 length:954 start_codon:yes stop_codon:yes gene_type:complete
VISNKSKIYVAGHNGMVGSAVWNKLNQYGYTNLVGKTYTEMDLKDQNSVFDFYRKEKPEIVIDAAARVGGILANKNYPYQFLMENMQIQNNLIDHALQFGVKKFIFLGSSCIYPKFAPQPLKEEYLLTGSLEQTNDCYAIAKIAGVKACEAIRKQFNKDFISLMPTNLYGFRDNFDLETSHVLPAMIRKFHEAKEKNNKSVKLWGSGAPKREFLFVEDLAGAVLFTLNNDTNGSIYNVGSGTEISIKNLAKLVQNTVGYKGEIIWDKNKPDGTPRKLLDVSKLEKLGWSNATDLKKGIQKTYKWFKENINNYRKVKL